jgi:hypothetical protein
LRWFNQQNTLGREKRCPRRLGSCGCRSRSRQATDRLDFIWTIGFIAIGSWALPTDTGGNAFIQLAGKKMADGNR